jgi:hypothetical protein
MTREMALIDETDMVCSFADGELACGQKFFRFSHPGLDHILMRRLAGRLFEQPGEVKGTHARGMAAGRPSYAPPVEIGEVSLFFI